MNQEPPLDWVPVYWAAHSVEAELLAGMLRSQGIAAGVRTNSTASGAGELPVDVLQTAVRVPPDQLQDAKQALADYERPSGADWVCSQCGEANGSAFETCWQCGNAR